MKKKRKTGIGPGTAMTGLGLLISMMVLPAVGLIAGGYFGMRWAFGAGMSTLATVGVGVAAGLVSTLLAFAAGAAVSIMAGVTLSNLIEKIGALFGRGKKPSADPVVSAPTPAAPPVSSDLKQDFDAAKAEPSVETPAQPASAPAAPPPTV